MSGVKNMRLPPKLETAPRSCYSYGKSNLPPNRWQFMVTRNSQFLHQIDGKSSTINFSHS
jgi:hypothetical protein